MDVGHPAVVSLAEPVGTWAAAAVSYGSSYCFPAVVEKALAAAGSKKIWALRGPKNHVFTMYFLNQYPY